MTEPQLAPPGLEGLIVADTSVGDVRGQEGFYHYRQYSAVELARKRTIEDVWFLLYNRALPGREERAEFLRDAAQYREIPADLARLLPQIATIPDSLAALRGAYALLAGTWGFKPCYEIGAAQLRLDALRSVSIVPSLFTALYRLRRGEQAVPPRSDLPFAANYLYMMTGEELPPEKVRAIEQYMILTIDHGFNASTFTARVITSTGADLGAAITGAIGALSGPLHGGAPSRVLDMLDAIGRPENADAYLRHVIEEGGRLMGFGHRVYRVEDPRSALLRELSARIQAPLYGFAEYVEERALSLLKELKPERALATNVEFYAGVLMDALGIDRSMFTPTFVTSRMIGWTAHIMEQAAHNHLIRPLSRYVDDITPGQPLPDA